MSKIGKAYLIIAIPLLIGFFYESVNGKQGFFTDLLFFRLVAPIFLLCIGIGISAIGALLVGAVIEFFIGVEKAKKFLAPLWALFFIALLIYNYEGIIEVLSTPLLYEINIPYWEEIKNFSFLFTDGFLLLVFLFYGIIVFGLGLIFVVYCWILLITFPLNILNEETSDKITEILFSIPSIILFMASGPIILYFFFSG